MRLSFPRSRALAAAVILVTGLATAVAFGGATPAHAGVLDVSCIPPSSETSTYSPPLTDTPQADTITHISSYGPCVSLSEPSLTSGTVHTVGHNAALSCADLLVSFVNTFTINWNNGQTSTVSGNAVTNIEDGVLTITTTGTVTSGLFAGDTVVEQVTGTSNPLSLCLLGEGTVPSIYGTLVLEITSV
jgi:hypothetical protein